MAGQRPAETSRSRAPTIAEAEQESLLPSGMPKPFPELSRNTAPANRTGLPAISVPCGFASGLPVGLMLIGRAFEEERLLHTATAYEATTDWHQAIPPVVAGERRSAAHAS
jgi:Asp-tRNA(Asn)/Glu-tRNA(Gln) amidotransferase A subunit family amidase